MLPTLYGQLASSAVSLSDLQHKYGSMLVLVEAIIGNTPNADSTLEIWKTGFRTYNILVPNLLNLPQSLFGSKSVKTLLGLATYASSRAAQCAYCSAHTCSFALRRGVTPEAILGQHNEKETAVISFAEALSRVPSDVSQAHYDTLTAQCSQLEAEQAAMGVVLMGFLNKYMDAMGIEIEQQAIDDTADLLTQTGWTAGKHLKGDIKLSPNAKIPQSDNLLTYFRITRHALGALKIERNWTKNVPNTYEKAALYLKKHTGHHFPILAKINRKRVIKAFTAILCDNFNTANTTIGLHTKALTGFIFATIAQNEYLIKEARLLSLQTLPHINEATFTGLKQLAFQAVPDTAEACTQALSKCAALPDVSASDAVALILARAVAPSPTQVNPAILQVVTPQLSAESTVELVVWVAIQQAMHRLERYLSFI